MIRTTCLWIALLLTFFPLRPVLAAPARTPAVVTAVRMGASPERLRIVVDTDTEVDYSTMVLSDPGRVVIDLHGATLGPDIARATPLDSRFASRVRVGQFKEDTVRIVVETSLGKGQFDVFSIEGGPVSYRVVMDFGQVGTNRKDHGYGDGADQPKREAEEPKPEGTETGETEKPEPAEGKETQPDGQPTAEPTGETTEPQPDGETSTEPADENGGTRPVGPTAPTPSMQGKGGSRDVTGATHKEGDSGQPTVPAGTVSEPTPPNTAEEGPKAQPEKDTPEDGQKEETEKKAPEDEQKETAEKKDESGKDKTETQKKDEARDKAGKKEDESDREELSEEVEFSPGIKGKVIVIDPGHGGEDSGAIGPSGVMEKDVTLRISKAVKALLKDAGAKVIMTRETDTEVSPKHRQATDVDELQARCDVANKAKADIFVSIHMDSFTSREATGTTGYYYLKGSATSRRLADAIQSSLVRHLRTVSRGVKTCRFYVVRHTKMPAALIEVAFLSNPKEEKLLTSEKGVKRAATGIVQGISDFFGN